MGYDAIRRELGITSAHKNVQELWEKGSTNIRGIEYEEICRAGKGIVASRPRNRLSLVYYPHPDHARFFAEALRFLDFSHPATDNPGSVGTLYSLVRGEGKATRAEIEWVQGSFIQGKPGSLTRSFVSRYGGWRQHLLKAWFEEIQRRNIGRAVLHLTELGGGTNATTFLEAAAEHGYKIVENETDDKRIVVARK